MESTDSDHGDSMEPASALEEMRRKRLAYFNKAQGEDFSISESLNHQEMHRTSTDSNVYHQDLPEKMFTEPSTSSFHKQMKYDVPRDQRINSENRQATFDKRNKNYSSGEPQISTSLMNKTSQAPSQKQPINSAIPKLRSRDSYEFESLNRLSLGESYDTNYFLKSCTDYDGLGLSTHRPESQVEYSSNGIEGQVYVPTSEGGGKLVRGIFSEKTTEEIRSALGEKGMQDLMMKVNQDFRVHRGRSAMRTSSELSQSPVHPQSPRDFQRYPNGRLSRSPSLERSTEMPSSARHQQSPRRRFSFSGGQSPQRTNSLVTKNLQQLKDGEKEVSTLVRNYDQVTVPKNTRNSFSSDEIYRQAFGGHGEYSSFDRYHRELQYSEPRTQAWQEKTGHSPHMDDRFHTEGRKFSFDSMTNMSPNHSPFVNHQNPFSYPPPPFHPTPYDSHPYPVSPHPSSAQAYPFNPHDSGYPSFKHQSQRAPGSQHSVYYTDQSHGSNSYPAQYVPSSPSAAPPSPTTFYYPPPTYSGSYGVPRFPNGVPLHLPPPPLLAQHMNSQGYGPPPQQFYPHPPPTSARRNSITQIGSSNLQSSQDLTMNGGYIKAPHPPHVPPALQPKNEVCDQAHHSQDHRHISGEHSHRTNQNGEPVSSFNLQRYFSSLELYDHNSSEPSPRHALQSSRSVEGDFYKSSADSQSTVSGVTSATKAGGVTQRLQDLGVDLDHIKHLRVVDTKDERETRDANFEKLSKGIRYCPECSASNKAYMNWCIECGEMLIGVEPVLPKSKNNRQGSAEEKKRKGSGNRSGRSKDAILSQENRTDRDIAAEIGCGEELYPRKESPESGRGLSLSSSPVRYRRDQEESGEPKDSGRASSGDGRERHMSLPQEENDDEEEEVIDLSGDEKEASESEEVEYVYEDNKRNLFEEIADPILREFIISYQKKKTTEEAKEAAKKSGETGKNSGNNSWGQSNSSSSVRPQNVASSSSEEVSVAMHHSQSAPQITGSSKVKVKEACARPTQSKLSPARYSRNEKCSEDKENSGNTGNVQAQNSLPEKRKKKKKKRKIGEAMDIEIFGYEETRLSRNSSRASNMNVVPSLNLACSSDEETSDSDDDDDDDEDGVDKSKNNVNDSDSSDGPASSSKPIGGPKPQSSSQGQKGMPIPQRQDNQKPVQQPLRTSLQSPPQSRQSLNQRRRGNPSMPSNYQRHWARSSTAWSSYNPRELNTRSSLNTSSYQNARRGGGRPASARVSHSAVSTTDGANCRGEGSSGIPVKQRPASAEYSHRRPAGGAETRQRPSSAKFSAGHANSHSRTPADQSRATTPQARQVGAPVPPAGRKSSNVPNQPRPPLLRGPSMHGDSSAASEPLPTPDSESAEGTTKEDDSPRILCAEMHRLPHTEVGDEYSDKLHAVARNAYDKLQEMTPRIADGQVSLWQCLPDEIWLYIFNFLSQGDLKHLMQTCHYFYRLANDETLWKYITVKPRCAMTDRSLATIADHHPISLAMVKCQGSEVTPEGLHYFFKETQGRLKELNICGSSQGSLVGSVLLKVAAQYCQQLTHLDASFCNISDEAFTAVCQCAERLESVCVNGFQSMSDSSLLALIKKHGRSLRTLELYACFSLNASVFRNLGEHCTSLRRLCLGSCNKLTDSAMVTLSTYLSRIEELDLRGCKNLRNDCIRKVVRNCPRIHTFVLANCQQISDIALTEIATYLKTTLRVLDVCGCNRVSDQGVISLAKNCDRLTSLDISSTRCTHVSVNQLASNGCSRWLDTVKLSFLTGLSEACMLHLIRQCPKLKLIHIFGCTGLRNLAKLRNVNPTLCVEGDVEVPRVLYHS